MDEASKATVWANERADGRFRFNPDGKLVEFIKELQANGDTRPCLTKLL